LNDIAVMLAIVLLAGVVTGISGFGFGLVSVATLATVRSLPEAVVMVNVIALFVCSYNLWTVRRDLNWRDALPLILSSLPMAVVGVYLLQTLDARWIEWMLAAAILAGCVVALWSPKAVMLQKPYPGSIVAGMLGGLLGGVLASGGPPVVLYCLLRGWDKSAMKAVLSGYFAVIAVWRLIVLATQGVATANSALLGLILLVPSFVGTYLGVRVFKRLSTTAFKYATAGLLVVLAVRLVAT
jgi:uncharacterized protein